VPADTALWHALEAFPGETTILREWQWALKDGFAHVRPFLQATGAQAPRWPVFGPGRYVAYFNLALHAPDDIVAWHEDGRHVENIPIEELALFQLQVPQIAQALAPHYRGRAQACTQVADGIVCVAPAYRGSVPVYLLHGYTAGQLLNRAESLLAARPGKCHLLIPTGKHLSGALTQLLEKADAACTVLEESFHCVEGQLRPVDHVLPLSEAKCWPSRIPVGTQWKDLSVCLDIEKGLTIALGPHTRGVSAKKLGLTKASSRTGDTPTVAWSLLLNFIVKGVIYADELDALGNVNSKNFHSALRSLRLALSAFFPGIPGDPLPVRADRRRARLSQAARTRYEPAFQVKVSGEASRQWPPGLGEDDEIFPSFARAVPERR
jgi:hypothetical protein